MLLNFIVQMGTRVSNKTQPQAFLEKILATASNLVRRKQLFFGENGATRDMVNVLLKKKVLENVG